jgi:signal transduction histidine kinase
MGNESEIRQVIMNLILNAAQSFGDDGGVITVRTCAAQFADGPPPGCYLLGNFRAGTYVCVAVEDAGCGMPQSMLPKLFQPFVTTHGGDHGFGLSVVQRIVRKHGGVLTVKSEAGHGSTFTILLPPAENGREE